MKKLVVFVLILALSLGVLGACGNSNNSNNNGSDNNAGANGANGATQQSSRTPAETVLLYADLCTARDLQGLTEILYGFNDMSWNFNDDDDETFVKMVIVVQNPNAQMEPYEIATYQSEFPNLIGTAIVCAEETSIYNVHATGEPHNYVQYLDYYLVSTQDHPDWRIVQVVPQAGQ